MSVAPLDLSVIIVSYNTRAMTLDCLRALFADMGGGVGGAVAAEVFVVDNASTDGSADAIRDRFPSVHLIANGRNVGFGAANNQAMRQARGRHLLLLNSDAFPRGGAVAKLVGYLDAHRAVGIVGPRLLNEDGSLQPSCYRFPTPSQAWRENLWLSRVFRRHERWGDYRYWAHDRERDVEWIVGACMMVRREVYEAVGGFDERFFMYAEETDWQKRIRDAGWGVAFLPDAVVTHLGGASGAGERPKINRVTFESLDYYEVKHHGTLGLVSLRTAMIVGLTLRLPAWTAVLLVRPAHRSRARAKIKLLSWLLVRQSTCWRLAS